MNHLGFNNIIAVLFLLLYFLFFASSANNDIEAADQLKEMRLEISQLNRKTGLLDLKNDDQDKEIRFLRNIISDLVIKQNGDEEMKSNHDNGRVVLQNIKRGARLLPLQLLMGREKEKPFIGPPSNCNDLNKIGYTLNGLFLVKENSTINPKISVIFCDFQALMEGKRPTSSLIVENSFGSVDVKKSTNTPKNLTGIYFYVNIGGASLMVPDNSVLVYDHQVLNIGRAMNLTTGVFTAPKAGIYTFAFSMVKNGFNYEYLDIFLRLNGKKVGHSFAGKGLYGMPVTLQSTLKLKKGDRVDLLKGAGGLHAVCSSFCHHFTGWLLEEDPKN